jgi:hypothetical protein
VPSSETNPAQSSQPTEAQPAVLPPSGGPVIQPIPSGANAGNQRPRDSRSQRNANVASPVAAGQPPAQEPAPVAQPPAPKQERAAAINPAEKKESSKADEKKDDKKASGISGAIKGGFKKLFGGDKKKDEKKP